MEPEAGFNAVESKFNRVVLPEPEGPIIATHSPVSIDKEIFFRVVVPLAWLKLTF
jgi:hypothetical protein